MSTSNRPESNLCGRALRFFGRHAPRFFDRVHILDAAKDSPLASVQLAVDTGIHSKPSWMAKGQGNEVDLD